jgi:pimeloyl-ACP methyl ester carboxylesterase
VLSVPEDRTSSNGREIELHFVVIPAIKRDPAPDALFLLAGGPGQSAIETFPVMLPMMFSIHQDRDIILVDQRGTGKSNPLRCLDPENESLDEEDAQAKLRNCPETLNADLRFYTTEIAMTDLDQVRATLGYETINLYIPAYVPGACPHRDAGCCSGSGLRPFHGRRTRRASCA